jgi:hypothetical protein
VTGKVWEYQEANLEKIIYKAWNEISEKPLPQQVQEELATEDKHEQLKKQFEHH